MVGRARVPGVPWPQVVGVRHVFIHVYWGIKSDKLWETLTVDLPLFVAALESALAQWPGAECDDPPRADR